MQQACEKDESAQIEDCLTVTRDIITMLSFQNTNASIDSIIPRFFYSVGKIDSLGLVFTNEYDNNLSSYAQCEYCGLVEKICVLKDGMTLPRDLEKAVSKGQIMLKHVPKIYRDEKVSIKVMKKNCNFHVESQIDFIATVTLEKKFELGSTLTFNVVNSSLLATP